MDEKDKRPPFPQANDLEKVVQIINVPDPQTVLNDDDLGVYLDGITSRQARYYIAAAKYLGILTPEKTFSESGEKLRNMNTYMQRVELIRIVLSDVIFGTAFYTEKVLGMAMYIVVNEGKGEWFSIDDAVHFLINIFEVPATAKKVRGIIDRNKSMFTHQQDPNNKRGYRWKLLSGAKDFAANLLQQ